MLRSPFPVLAAFTALAFLALSLSGCSVAKAAIRDGEGLIAPLVHELPAEATAAERAAAQDVAAKAVAARVATAQREAADLSDSDDGIHEAVSKICEATIDYAKDHSIEEAQDDVDALLSSVSGLDHENEFRNTATDLGGTFGRALVGEEPATSEDGTLKKAIAFETFKLLYC